MPQEKKVKDLLTPLEDYPHLPYWATLKDALIQLSSAQDLGINTVLVFDEAYRLVGMLTQANLLRGIAPRLTPHYEDSLPTSWSSLLDERAGERMSKQVKDFMVPARVMINANDELLTACEYLLRENQELLTVQENNRIIGVIKLDDVFREIVDLLMNS